MKKIVLFIFILVFSLNAKDSFEEFQKIVASDRDASDKFGNSVSISGDYAIVGAFLEDENTTGEETKSNAGSAYIFKKNNGTWEEVQKITASDRDTSDNFGNSVSISGDYAIVGAYYEDENATGEDRKLSAGSAYIFKNNNGIWEEIQKITASDRYNTLAKKSSTILMNHSKIKYIVNSIQIRNINMGIIA